MESLRRFSQAHLLIRSPIASTGLATRTNRSWCTGITCAGSFCRLLPKSLRRFQVLQEIVRRPRRLLTRRLLIRVSRPRLIVLQELTRLDFKPERYSSDLALRLILQMRERLLAYAITDTDEGIRVARDWIATNAGTTGPAWAWVALQADAAINPSRLTLRARCPQVWRAAASAHSAASWLRRPFPSSAICE
jgi:hypothetical protein